MPYKLCEPVVDLSVRELCPRPYRGHPKGCPNYGKRPTCPPASPTIDEVIRLDKPVWAIWNVFGFGAHVWRMRRKHPDWSQRQLECCLYWQGTARKALRREIKAFGDSGAWKASTENDCGVVECPEACGVDLTATMKAIGIVLEWPPKTVAYQIVLAGESV